VPGSGFVLGAPTFERILCWALLLRDVVKCTVLQPVVATLSTTLDNSITLQDVDLLQHASLLLMSCPALPCPVLQTSCTAWRRVAPMLRLACMHVTVGEHVTFCVPVLYL
jgi:hypothetical protein